jgi:hypothetical protein
MSNEFSVTLTSSERIEPPLCRVSHELRHENEERGHVTCGSKDEDPYLFRHDNTLRGQVDRMNCPGIHTV